MSGRRPYDPRCSFCRVSESTGARIVHGPGGVNICRCCVRIAVDILGGHYIGLPPAVRRTWRPRWRTVGRWKARGLPEIEPGDAASVVPRPQRGHVVVVPSHRRRCMTTSAGSGARRVVFVPGGRLPRHDLGSGIPTSPCMAR